ncbi:MAG: hypothetical protein AAGL99_06335 [Pseudomonadota bacterium]
MIVSSKMIATGLGSVVVTAFCPIVSSGEVRDLAFQYVDADIAPLENTNPFAPFIGTWTLKDDQFQQVWDGVSVETLTIPKHITRCEELNTNQSVLCVVDAGGLKGQIYWTQPVGRMAVSHLSQFGDARIGTGSGMMDEADGLTLKIMFSDEPEGTYRIYEYRWQSEDSYTLMSRQYNANGNATGNWYGGTFVRVD